MKKIVIGGLGIILALGIARLLTSKSQITPLRIKLRMGKANDKFQTNSKIQITKPAIKVISSHSRSIFVPYWSGEINEKDTRYNTYYYFGIRPTREGKIDYNDAGFKQISLVQSVPSEKKELVLRMLDASITETILEDKSIQKALISEVKNILVKKSFSGLILDIEIPFTFQANKQNQITQFVQQICTAIKVNYKSCNMLVYGDFSYRKRPYDLKKLSQYSDKILLMAYDFHKAGGEPGPNFSFGEKKKYGYDFKQMISDATALVQKEKIEVVFGMYGYDWTLNEQGTPLKGANALSLKGIRTLISNDKLQITNQSQITNSKEKNIEYIDEEGRKHIIWYEDGESAQIKINYLQEQGIFQVSYWAYGYY